MKHYKQFHPLIISDFEREKWNHPEHKHNHYEIIYIKHGMGNHVINQVIIPYQDGDVFFVGPDEAHYFDIYTPTRFIYVKFMDIYSYQNDYITISGARDLEYLINSRETHLSGFNLGANDRHTASLLFDIIIALQYDLFHNERLIWLQLLSLANILQRNMPEFLSIKGRTKHMQAIFCYLHKNIYTPDKLKAAVMAVHFNITADYIGPYFKRNTGTTLRDYIGVYRKSLLSNRIASGNFSLKQLAAEFGLSDESHVSKLLQKKSHSKAYNGDRLVK